MWRCGKRKAGADEICDTENTRVLPDSGSFNLRELFLLFLVLPAAFADNAPVLQWVKTAGGSGSTVAAAAGDAKGNLYIVGSTTSVDFPTTATASQSTPGGSMLERITLANGAASPLFPANLPPVSVVAASAAAPGTLYAASGYQIWKSTDAGSTWTMTSGAGLGVITTPISTLAVDPSNPNTVYAGSSLQGAFKSTDGGVTFAPINAGITPSPSITPNVQGIWVDPAAPSVVFVSCNGVLLRSSDGGSAWMGVGTVESGAFLAFDSTGAVYFATGNTVQKSTDAGQTFSALASLPAYIYIQALAADTQSPGVLYAGTTGGIYKFASGTWTQKLAGGSAVMVADPSSSAVYASYVSSGATAYGIVKSTNGFTTISSVGPPEPAVQQLVISGPNLFEVAAVTNDVFAIKLDNNGNVVYSALFGGSGNDNAAALAVGSDGSVYVTGATNSADLPVTAGAYLTAMPSAASFLFKLNPNGSLAWATYVATPASSVLSIAADAQGNSYIGGTSAGGLTTTPGAYQTTFTQSFESNGFFGVFGPPAGFVSKFNPNGTGLVYSTYVSTDTQNNTVAAASALAVDATGNAWIGVNDTFAMVSSGNVAVAELNSTGSAVLASANQPGLGGVQAITLDASSNVYIAGSFGGDGTFAATAGAFQSAPQPAIPNLNYEPTAGGGSDAFIAKFDSSLSHLVAATLLGGEAQDGAMSIALDAAGNVIVSGYTDSFAFPTHAPFQTAFAEASGFVAGFDATLSHLEFSTYLGGAPFALAGAALDSNGNILIAGNTLAQGSLKGASPSGGQIVANKIALPAAPAVRLDTVENYASRIAAPLAPGEPIVATGAGFGAGAQIVLDGAPLSTLSATATSIVALMPAGASTSVAHTLRVTNNGVASNPVFVPAAAASPAIYSVDGSGYGQGYILNSDGTMNSQSNPAAPGSAITIFVAAPGPYTVMDGYAVTEQPPAVFLDGGIYCDGIAAVIGPVNGLPGNVYRISVYIPTVAALAANDPDLANFTYPAQTGIQFAIGPGWESAVNPEMASQNGIFVSIK